MEYWQLLLAAIIGGTVFAVWLFKSTWRIAEPNEALIISGFGARGESDGHGMGFKVVSGKGTVVIPGFQHVRRMNLDLREADLEIECVTHQGIPLRILGVVIFKVGDDYASIANSARRFLDQQDQMGLRVHNVFSGHLRAIVGNMTVEEMIRDRDKLTQLTRESSGVEMEKLGLVMDSLQIQEIDDPTGYIANLSRPHAAAVERDARIAQASADQLATEKEQAAEALKAEARRNTQIKQAGFQAEVDRAAATAKQSGPLADAQAHQEVVVQETRVAELEGHREEQRLQATVRKPADAKAYEQVTLAKASRDAQIADSEGNAREVELKAIAEAQSTKVRAEAEAERVRLTAVAGAEQVRITGEAEAAATQAKGMAEGEAVRAKGMAAAESIKARADALAHNQEAVIGQQLAERWPEIVEAAARPFAAIDNLTVLNGAQGLSDALAQAMSQGVAGLQLARNLIASGGGTAAGTAVTSNGEVKQAVGAKQMGGDGG